MHRLSGVELIAGANHAVLGELSFEWHPIVPVEIDDEELQAVLKGYRSIPTKKRALVDVALTRFNRAVLASIGPDKALDLGVALEILLAHDRDAHSPITHLMRIRAAWFLGTTVDERHEIFMQVRDLYDLRSAAAHTGTLGKEKGAQSKLEAGERLCKQVLARVLVDGGFPADWDRLVLGGPGSDVRAPQIPST